VFPGDKVHIEVWEYHEGSRGFGSTSTPLTTLITMVSGAFGGVSGGGESGLIYNSVNAAINAFVPGGNLGTDRPAAYLNYILFDENYNLLDMLARRSHLTILDSITKLSGEGGGWKPAPDVTFTKQKLSFNTINVKQEGYLFAYLSYDNDSNNCLPAIAIAKAGYILMISRLPIRRRMCFSITNTIRSVCKPPTPGRVRTGATTTCTMLEMN